MKKLRDVLNTHKLDENLGMYFTNVARSWCIEFKLGLICLHLMKIRIIIIQIKLI